MIVFLAGLPRTGSTLMSALLNQNPLIHSEGSSGLCQLMWDTHVSCAVNAREQLTATGRANVEGRLLGGMAAAYYADVNRPVIVDKCRTWPLPANMRLIREHITGTPKVIVLTRPVQEVVESFIRLRREAGWEGDIESDLWVNPEPLARAVEATGWALTGDPTIFHHVTYEHLISDPAGTLAGVYEFMGWEPYEHTFTNIVHPHPEDDTAHGLPLHTIRSTISRRDYAVA